MSTIINCEIITVVPRCVDYPAFRKRLKELEPYVNKIHYVFNYHAASPSSLNYSGLIQQDMPFCNFINIDAATIHDHWYNVGMKTAFDQCTSDYVLFLEPDFIFKTSEILNVLSTFTRDILTHGNRPTVNFGDVDTSYPCLSPSFFMVKRSLALQTSLEFGEGTITDYTNIQFNMDGTTSLVAPAETTRRVDCFNRFTNDLFKLTTDICLLNDLGITNYYHYNGITHNFTLCRMGEYATLHNAEEFVWYLNENLNLDGIAYDQAYIDESNTYLAAIGSNNNNNNNN